jgi:catalase-peroxidase
MDAKTDDKSAGKCPFTSQRRGNRVWWPVALSLVMLNRISRLWDQMGKDFVYAKVF